MTKYYLITVLIILLLMMTGILFRENTEEEKLVDDVPNKEEILDKYIHLKNKIVMQDGQISIQAYQHQFSNLYSTYFIIKSLSISEYKFSQKEKEDLKIFIFKELNKIKDNDESLTLMYDIYYAYKLIETLKIEINKNEVGIFEEVLNKLKLSNGAFSSNLKIKDEDEESLIFSTSQAIEILHNLNLKITNNTKIWLTSKMNNLNFEYNNYNTIIMAYKSFELIKEKIDFPEENYNRLIKELNFKEKEKQLNLFDVNLYLNISRLVGKREFNLEEKIYSLLKQNQNEDFGWNVFLNGYTEEQGIAIAVDFIKYSGKRIPEEKELKQNLELQKNIDGGFSPFYEKTFSLENTFLVYSIDNLLDLNNKQKLIVNNIPINSEEANMYEIYYYINLLKMNNISNTDFNYIELERSLVEKKQFFKESLNTDIQTLHSYYYYLKTINLLNPDYLKEFKCKTFWLKNKENLNFEESLILLNILKITGELTEDDVLTFIQNFKKEFNNSLEEPYVIYLLSNLIFDNEKFQSIFTKLVSSVEIGLNNQIEDDNPLSLINLYYLLSFYSNINDYKNLN